MIPYTDGGIIVPCGDLPKATGLLAGDDMCQFGDTPQLRQSAQMREDYLTQFPEKRAQWDAGPGVVQFSGYGPWFPDIQ